MRILTIVGARPQFIKAAVVSRALTDAGVEEAILHTGQHYDARMSEVFFRQLDLKPPAFHLELGGGMHGRMTGRMLEAIEERIVSEKPDAVLVYGDTNSTLAGALAAAKLLTPIVHVEAGLRSFDRRMPEEINRVLTDRLSQVLFCPTDEAVANLRNEGIEDTASIVRTGDVMLDAALMFAGQAVRPDLPASLDRFVLATMHRAENTDDPDRLVEIVSGLNRLNAECPVIVPLHPRTHNAIASQDLKAAFTIIDPVGYFEMLWLLQNCSLVVTDSGGVQKEAFFHGRSCITMRDTTEWVELVEARANVLVGADADEIHHRGHEWLDRHVDDPTKLYGDGTASTTVARHLASGIAA